MLQERQLQKEELKISQYYQEVFPVNLTALRESVWHLVTNVICGENLPGSFSKLGLDGLWERTLQGYYQVSLDGSSDEFCETWPEWGIMLDGVAYQPMQLAPRIVEPEFSLLPAPIATDFKGCYSNHEKLMKHIKSKDHQVRISELLLACGVGKKQIVEEYEQIMGFPIGWTELSPVETA